MKYLKNIWYVLNHKYYVLIECFREGLYWQGIIHDLSKFGRSEFVSYSWNFFNKSEHGKYGLKGKPGMRHDHFYYAWLHHIHANGHHWEHWILDGKPLVMPVKYMLEMLCDWRAMARVFGDTATKYYSKHRARIILHPHTRKAVEDLLKITLYDRCTAE